MMLRGLIRRISSPVLALWLIVLLIALNALAVIVPQRELLGSLFEDFATSQPVLARALDVVGLDRIFSGWIIAVVAALLAANVTVCTVRRIGRALAPLRASAGMPEVTATLSVKWADADEYLTSVRRTLDGLGWQTAAVDDVIVGRRGRSGFLGSIVLHLSILVLIVGGTFSSLTTFRGEMRITDGQTVVDDEALYMTVSHRPDLGAAFTGARITLDSTEVRYEQGVVVSAVAKMRGVDREGDLVAQDVRVNYPFQIAGKSYLIMDSGYAAEVTIELPDGTARTQVVNLTEESGRGWQAGYDLGEVLGEGTGLLLTGSPVPLSKDATLPAERFVLSDPRLTVGLVGADGVRLEPVTLAEGESAPLGQGVSVTFEDLRLWNRFLVRGDSSRWIVYVGFWLAVIGAGWRFLVAERRVFATVAQDDAGVRRVGIGCRARPWAGFESGADFALLSRLATLAEAGPEREGDIRDHR